MAETRNAAAKSLSKEAMERILSRESTLHNKIRVHLQVVKLGEHRSTALLQQPRESRQRQGRLPPPVRRRQALRVLLPRV